MREQSNSTAPITRNMKRRQGQRLSVEERKEVQRKFLDSFKLNANVTLACMQAGIDRSQIYRWQEHDEMFAQEFKQAELAANDMLLAAAWQRGVKGTEKPVVSMGKQVFVKVKENGKEVEKPLMERVYSDSLLSLLMKARMPEFRDKQQVDVNANVTGSVQSDLSNELRLLTSEQLVQFKAWLQEAKAKQEW